MQRSTFMMLCTAALTRTPAATGSTWHRTATRSSLPVPCGRLTVARSCWSEYFGSMFSRAWNSTVSVKLAEAVCRIVATASAGAACQQDCGFRYTSTDWQRKQYLHTCKLRLLR